MTNSDLSSRLLCLTGVPKFETTQKSAKLDKMRTILYRELSIDGAIVPINLDITLSTEEPSATLGHAFAEYQSYSDMSLVLKKFPRRKFQIDKSNIITLIQASEIDEICQSPEEYVEPDRETIHQEYALDRWDWLLDHQQRDQLIIQHGDQLELHWMNWRDPGSLSMTQGPSGAKGDHPSWPLSRSLATVKTAGQLSPSSQGSYVVSRPENGSGDGVKLFAGSDLRLIREIPTNQVTRVSTSPLDGYLITEESDSTDIWDMLTGELKHRVWLTPPSDAAIGRRSLQPAERVWWSFDERFAAYLISPNSVGFGARALGSLLAKESHSQLLVFDTKTWTLIKDLAIPSVCGFAWSHTGYWLAYWTAERGSTPCAIDLVELKEVEPKEVEPKEVESGGSETSIRVRRLSTKLIYSVVGVDFYWSTTEPLLAYRVDRQGQQTTVIPPKDRRERARVKQNTVTMHEIGVCRVNSDSNHEILTLPSPASLVELGFTGSPLSWEPDHHRFSVVTDDGTLTVFEVGTQTTEVLATTAIGGPANVTWSPLGEYMVVTVEAPSGSLTKHHFCRLEKNPVAQEGPKKKKRDDATTTSVSADIQVLQKIEQPYRRVAWAPSGLYVGLWSIPEDRPVGGAGYSLWSEDGSALEQIQVDNLRSMCWRPRPVVSSSESRRQIAVEARSKLRMAEHIQKRQNQAAEQREHTDKLRRQQADEFQVWRKSQGVALENSNSRLLVHTESSPKQ